MSGELEEVVFPIPAVFSTPPWTRIKRGVFTARQCDRIVEHCERSVGFECEEADGLDRKTETSFLHPDGMEWVYQKLAALFARENVWNFALTAITEPFRIYKYGVGAYRGDHSDVDYTTSDHSKITAVVQLVSSRSWSGGRLCVGSAGPVPKLEKGDCVLFPSFSVHEVTPVTRGTRVTLTAWAAGPPLT